MFIFKAILGFFLKLKQVVQDKGGELFQKIRDPDTGRILKFTPNQLKKILLGSGIVFFAAIVIYQISGDSQGLRGGGDAYKKEISSDASVGQRELDFNPTYSDNPLGLLGDALGRGVDEQGRMYGGDGEGYDGEDAIDPNKPSEAECLDLMEKMKNNIPLNDKEKIKFETCLTENIGGFTADEIAIARKLLSGELSPEEAELLRKMLAGELEEGSDEWKLAKALLKGGEEAELARAALAALASGDRELYDTIMKALNKEALTDEEKARLEALKKALGLGPGGRGVGRGGSGLSQDFLAKLGVPDEEELIEPLMNFKGAGGTVLDQIQGLTEDIANRENEIKALEDEISEAQVLAARAAEKLAKGLKLTPEEQMALERLAALQKKLRALKKLQAARKNLLAGLMRTVQNSLVRANATMLEFFPSGTTVELAIEDECKNPRPFVAKKKKRGKSKFASKSKKELWLDPSGRKLTPDEIRFIKLARLKKLAEERERDSLTNPGNDILGTDGTSAVDSVAATGGNQRALDLKALFVYQNQAQKEFVLTPDMKIPAVLDSQILVSDKGRGQIVRVRILDDVYDPATNTLVIPKNSIATGSTQGFDPDTAIMDFTFDKVVVGGKIMDVKLQVGSANGTMGLKGQVRDTRGKYLLGAFITSFTGGALNWFSQTVVQRFLDDTSGSTSNALSGAALQGGAEVANQIAEMYAGDLQNAAKIFWVPRNVPIVLFPTGI